jgi:hypothetical protein
VGGGDGEEWVAEGRGRTMNKRIKKLWIKALRSGKYKQARSALRVVENGDTGYCCLGVLCEVYRRSTKRGDWEGSTFMVDGVYSMSQVPSPVCDWAKLEQPNPRLGRVKTAITLNDNGKPFSLIADRIEKYL